MDFKDTVEMMLSEDYTKRLIAEYIQLKLRYERLAIMIDKVSDNAKNMEGTKCDIQLLRYQKQAMAKYMYYLEKRLEFENIELPEPYVPLGGLIWQ